MLAVVFTLQNEGSNNLLNFVLLRDRVVFTLQNEGSNNNPDFSFVQSLLCLPYKMRVATTR